MPVFSLDHFRLTRVDKWFAEVHAYVDNASLLFDQMAEGAYDRTFHRAKSAAFVFAHGVELFLKAAIANASSKVDRSHDLNQLYRTYRNRYAAKRFAFSASMEGFINSGSETPYFQFLKYPENETGVTWQGNVHFDVATWSHEINAFAAEMNRLQPLIKERYNKSAVA